MRNSVAWSHGHNLTSALLNIRGKELQLSTKFAMWMDAEQIMNSGIRDALGIVSNSLTDTDTKLCILLFENYDVSEYKLQHLNI